MNEALNIVVLGRAARNGANIKNRQPLSEICVKTDRQVDDYYRGIVEDELNVKKATFSPDISQISSYSFKPQLRTVGPKYGKQLGNIRKALSEIDGNAAMDTLKADGALKFDFGGELVVLTEDDLLIEMAQTEGYVSEGDNYVTVALDTHLTPELLEEGFVRELVSKIQTMRKEAGFEVTDHIAVYESGNEKLAELTKKFEVQIKKDVLADEIIIGQMDGYTKEWNINGETVTM